MKALSTPAPVLNPPPEKRHTARPEATRGEPTVPSPDAVRAFVQSIDAGGQP